MVAPPLLLAAVQRRAATDRDECVLESTSALVVYVDVAGGDCRNAEVAGEVAEDGVPTGVAALERALELDVEAVRPKCRCNLRSSVWVTNPQAAPSTAGQADQSFGVLEQPVER